MIVDTIENAKQYRGIHPGIDRILEAVRTYTPDNYPVGRVYLDSEKLYMNLEEYETHARMDGMAEAHQKCIDVMYIVEGAETVYVKPTARLWNIVKEYDPGKDILLAGIDEDASPIRLEEGSFLVLFPQDAHGPGCHAAETDFYASSFQVPVPGKVKKIVGKVRMAL